MVAADKIQCSEHKRGFNLVEAAIVLGVIGLVIGGIWVAASNVAANQRRQELFTTLIRAQQQMEVLARDVSFSGVGYQGDYTLPIFGDVGLIQHSTIPADIRTAWYYQDTNYLAKPLDSGYLTVLYESLAGGGRRYHYLLGPLDQADCIWLARKIWNISLFPGFSELRFNIGYLNGGGASSTTVPPDASGWTGNTVDDVVSTCASGKVNAIDFQMAR